MISVFKNFSFRIIELIPLLLLFYISLSGNSVINLNFFTVNIHYILIYYWVLKQPRTIGYGFIFLSGIITDVIFGLPIGATALSLLIVSAVAAYARAVTVRINLINDWHQAFLKKKDLRKMTISQIKYFTKALNEKKI